MSDPQTTSYHTKVAVVAKAIAWCELTQHGRMHCRWPDSFSGADVKRYEAMAMAAMEALDVK